VDWTAIDKPRDGLYWFQNYYTEIWFSEKPITTGIWSSWSKIDTIYGLGDKNFDKKLLLLGECRFLLKEYAEYKGYYDWHTMTNYRINGPFFIAQQESGIITVNLHTSVDLTISDTNINFGESLTLEWWAITYNTDWRYPYGVYTKVMTSRNGEGWTQIATVNGVDLQSYTFTPDLPGNYNYRVEVYASGYIDSIYHTDHPGHYLIDTDEIIGNNLVEGSYPGLENFFDFEYDIPGSIPWGWTRTTPESGYTDQNTADSYIKVVNSNEVSLNKGDTPGNLLEFYAAGGSASHPLKQQIAKDLNLQDIDYRGGEGEEPKIIYLKFDIGHYNYDPSDQDGAAELQIKLSNGNIGFIITYMLCSTHATLGIKNCETYADTTFIYNPILGNTMTTVELALSFINDMGIVSATCQAYVDGIFRGIYTIPIGPLYDITDLSIIHKTGSISYYSKYYLDNFYCNLMDIEESSEEFVKFPIPIAWIEPPEIANTFTNMIFYYYSSEHFNLDLTVNIPIFSGSGIGGYIPMSGPIATWDDNNNDEKQIFYEGSSFSFEEGEEPTTETVIVYYKVSGYATKLNIKYPDTDIIVRTVLSNFRDGSIILTDDSVTDFNNDYGYLGDLPENYGPNLIWEEKPQGEFFYNYSEHHNGNVPTDVRWVDMVKDIDALSQELVSIEWEEGENTIFDLSFFGLVKFGISYSYSEATVYFNQIFGKFTPEKLDYRFHVFQPVNYSHPWGIHQISIRNVLGDVNYDGSIDLVDANLVFDYIHGLNPEIFDEEASDVNQDGIIDLEDRDLILNMMNK